MTLRQYVEFRTDEQDGSQVLDRNHHIVAEEQLIPRIIKRNRQALLLDPHAFHYFQRRRQGRRCSCFTVETSPDGHCQVCFGNGVVGGYDKFGTAADWFDVTYPRTRTVNVVQNFQDASRPIMFTLLEGAVEGYVEFDWQIRPNIRVTDLFQVVSRDTPGTTFDALISDPDGALVPMTDATLNAALTRHSATIRIVMRRESTAIDRPILSHVMIRYRLCHDVIVQMDVPRVTESVALSEYGVFDSFTTMSGWIADQVKVVSTDDFFRRITDNTYWKSIESQPNMPLQQSTSTDVTLRLIQKFENYFRFPV